MNRQLLCWTVIVALVFAAFAQDQDEELVAWMQYAQPSVYHSYLDPMIGSWDTASRMWDCSGNCYESQGTCESKWILGGRFVYTEYQEPNFMGGGLLGYDNFKKKYVFIWVDTMSTGIFYSKGDYDEASRTLTCVGKAHDVATGEEKSYKLVTYISPDGQQIVDEMYEVKANGEESKCMEITYTRMSERRKYFKFLEYFVGTWHGEGEIPGMGPYKDKFVCEWVMNQTFLQCSHEAKVNDEVVWQDIAMWGWDIEKQCPRSFSFGMDGNVGVSDKVTLVDEKTEVVEGHTAGSEMAEWRTTTTRIDNDHFVIVMDIKQGGEYVKFLESKYTREK